VGRSALMRSFPVYRAKSVTPRAARRKNG
jgi:hypothetical protein